MMHVTPFLAILFMDLICRRSYGQMSTALICGEISGEFITKIFRKYSRKSNIYLNLDDSMIFFRQSGLKIGAICNKKRFLCYILYGWGLTSLSIISIFILDKTEPFCAAWLPGVGKTGAFLKGTNVLLQKSNGHFIKSILKKRDDELHNYLQVSSLGLFTSIYQCASYFS